MGASRLAAVDGSRGRSFWPGVLLAGMTVAAYLPALRGGFVWDDDATLFRNPVVLAGDGLRRIWLTGEARDFWPVTYSALWAQWRAWGPHPLGYHAFSVALHVGGVFLLWAVLRQIWSDPAGTWLAAALFALHPVNAEAVAWITQQKSLLAMIFYLGSIHFFLRTRWSGGGEGTAGSYGLSLGAFILAMLSKGSAAMLPCVLLGLIRWRRQLGRRDLALIAPFFLAALILVAVNVAYQGRVAGGMAVRDAGPLARVLGAAAAGWFYLGRALWPGRLMFLYPEWSVSARSGFWWLPLGGAVAVTALLGRLASARTGPGDRLDAAGWARPAWFAWGYFWVSLVPVLGFVDVYYMRYAPVADHYQHLAIIGVAVGVAAAWRPCAARLPAGSARAVPLAVLAVLGLLTWRQCLMYRDNRSLYLTAISRNPRAWLAEFNWGEQLLEKGRAAGAIDYFAAALRAKPDYFEAHNNLGIALAESGRAAEAAAQFEEAVRLNPAYAPAHLNLGKARLQQRRGPEAMAQFREAAQLNPRDAEVRRALGLLLRALGREAEARDELAAAARLDRRP